jgi:hypothetical protein
MRREYTQDTGEVIGGPVTGHIRLAEPDAARGANPLIERRRPNQLKYWILAAAAAIYSAGRFDDPKWDTRNHAVKQLARDRGPNR